MKKNSYKNYPDKNGNFEQYGGRYVAETLMPLILDLEKKYLFYKKNICLLRKSRKLWEY